MTNPKPSVIAIREAENKLVACATEIIKTSGLPCSVIELIFDKVHRQIKDGVNIELESAKRAMVEAENENTQQEPESSE